MSTLRVHDSRSRTRSKSPSGRIRERSRSRDPREPSPLREKHRRSSKKYYYDSDSAEEAAYASSRGSKKYYYDHYSGDDKYRRSEAYRRSEDNRRSEEPKKPPGSYISDEDVPQHRKSAARPPKPERYRYNSDDDDRRYSSRIPSSKPVPKYEQYSDSLTDSEDDALAYGEMPHAPSVPRIPSYERLRERNDNRPSKKYYDSESTTASSKYTRPLDKLRGEESRDYHSRHDRDSEKHPSYAQPGAYRYAQPPKLHQDKPIEPKSNQYGSNPSQYPIDWAEVPECERPGFVPPPDFKSPVTSAPPSMPIPATNYPMPDPTPPPQAPNPPNQYTPVSQDGYNYHQYPSVSMPPPSSAAVPLPTTAPSVTPGHQRAYSTGGPPTTQQYYAQPPPFQYAQPDANIKYISKSSSKPYTQSSANQFVKPYSQTGDVQYVEIKPKNSTGRPHSLSVSTSNGHMNVPGGFPDSGPPPASPLLEPYKGTYQTISPMPWPTSLPSHMDEGLSDLEPLDGLTISAPKSKKDKSKKPDSNKAKGKESSIDAGVMIIAPTVKKKVSFYDPKPDAKELKAALIHSNVDPKPLLDILPYLSSEDLLALRAEYKNHAKLAGKGVNIAKHIKMQVPGNFGKVCYATALGRWESEAHWANFYYQTNSLRRELLLESLVGRTNAEIREIKKCFRDKRYGDDLERCMKAELRADKFRTAILLALEGRRQSNNAPSDSVLIRNDMNDLHRALIAKEGGETAMIKIIIVRGDSHLREVLRLYEATYRKNFARELITKSQNLVGETLLHVLNGALNRPMRDALLLRQAITEGTARERAELLISRLVRMHWEPLHLERVKSEYKKRYGQSVEKAIEEKVMSGVQKDWAEFCIGLARSPTVHIANGNV
ncbi:hypothetical protein AJ79_04164 [Helicocarpus griseus UAMH5409]|uniref:Annexin n=1 Tax=Helicocarpus griseus UAMH5409 TaxID=1447875 RepID=A0A2B7XLN4_9EURO|nr:hypothetical protein AJ79_04164 [Helicocarpus griseus UAMH5409]